MKLLVISDLHAHNDVLDKMDDIFKQADAVLFAGDLETAIMKFLWATWKTRISV